MKKFFISIAVIIVLIAGAVMAVPYFLPKEKIIQIVREKGQEATGREITVGHVGVRIFPSIALTLSDFAIGNPSWAKEKNLLEVGRLDVRLALRPLLEKRVEVSRFSLKNPVIHLEKSTAGKGSWEIKPPSAQPSSGKASGGTSSAANDLDIRFGKFHIDNGLLTYNDHASESATKVEKINVVITFPDLKSAVQLDGDLFYNEKRVGLALEFEKPMALAEGKSSPGAVNIKTDLAHGKLSGTFSTAGTMFKGNVEAAISDLPQHMVWVTGKEQPIPFQKVAYKSSLNVSATQAVLDGAALTLDEIEAKGNVKVGFAGKPDIFARLSLNKLNLDRFMPEKTAGKGPAGPAPAGVSSDWDAAPMDFSALKSVNVDAVLDTQGFSLKGAEVGSSKLAVQLRDGKLRFTSSEALLFDGVFSSELSAEAAATPMLAFKFMMKDVQAKPILSTFANFKKLSGGAFADVSATSKGHSQRDIINNLNGNVSVTFKNGALEGIDLVNIAQLLQKKMTDMSIGGGKTEFVDMGGTFTITNGVASNQDFAMRGPLVQAKGAGTIDLPKKYIQYRVTPKLTASSGEDNAKGLGIPVDIKGPFSGIKVKPDYAGAVRNVLNNPEAVKETIHNVRDQAKGLQGMMKDIGKNPDQALGALLGVPPKKKQEPAAPVEPPVPEAVPVEAVPAEEVPAP